MEARRVREVNCGYDLMPAEQYHILLTPTFFEPISIASEVNVVRLFVAFSTFWLGINITTSWPFMEAAPLHVAQVPRSGELAFLAHLPLLMPRLK